MTRPTPLVRPARHLSGPLSLGPARSRPGPARRYWAALVAALALIGPSGLLAVAAAPSPAGAANIPTTSNSGALSQLPGVKGCIEEAPANVGDTCGQDTLDQGGGVYDARALAAWGGYVFVAGGGSRENGEVIAVLKAGPDGLRGVSCINGDGSGPCAKAAPLGMGNVGDISSIAVSPDGDHVYVGADSLLMAFAFNHATGAITWGNDAGSCVSQDGTDGASGHCTKAPAGLTPYANVVSSPDGNYLYNFGNGGNSSVVTYKVGTDGSLTPVGCLDCGSTDLQGALDVEVPNFGGLGGLALNADGTLAYGVDPGTATLWLFDVVPAGQPGAGSLALPDDSGSSGPANYCIQEGSTSSTCAHHGWGLAGLTGGVVVGGSAASPDIYVVNGGEGDPGSVVELSGATPGALAEMGCASSSGTADGDPSKACTKQVGLADAGDPALSPDGKNLYVAAGDETPGQVVELGVDPSTGALSPGACYSDDGAGGFGTAYPGCTHFQGLDGIGAHSDPNSAIAVSPTGAPTVSPSGTEVYVAAGQDSSVADLARSFSGAVLSLPGVPTGLTATPGDGEVGLSWSAPGTQGAGVANGYTVLWRLSSSTSPHTLSVQGATSHIVGGLRNGDNYQFAVEASNRTGTGPATAWVTAKPSNSAPPLPPTEFSAAVSALTQDGGVSGVRVQLHWHAPAPGSCVQGSCALSGYVLSYDKYVQGGKRSTSVDLPARPTSDYVDLPANETEDNFELAAKNGYGTGPQVLVQALLELVPGAPAVTGAVTVQGVDLQWLEDTTTDQQSGIGPISTVIVKEASGASKAYLPRSSSQVKWVSVSQQHNGTTRAFYTATVSGVPAGTSLSFTVSIADDAGLSPAVPPRGPHHHWPTHSPRGRDRSPRQRLYLPELATPQQ